MKVMKTTKKILSMLLLMLMVIGLSIPASILLVSAEEKTVSADAINAGRNAGQLVIFTSEFGATTGTNEWGYEVVVENNIVTKVGDNNNTIPANGFVLSGHDVDEGTEGGKMKTYLMENVKVGNYVYYNESTLMVTIADEPVAVSDFYTVETTFDDVNKVRYENQLIIYNTKGTYTGSNEWGYEVVVENNTVVSMGSNNSLIPNKEGSFVVSGHGTKVEWMKLHVKIGMSASYDLNTKTITFVYDEKSATIGINLEIEALEASYATAIENYAYIDYTATRSKLDEINSTFTTAKNAFDNGGALEDFDAACSSINELIAAAKMLLTESRTVEYRGVWVRPTQKTTQAVEDYVQSLYDAGINLICVETLYSSTMIMPMPEDSLFEQNPAWKGFDMLQAYIDACHSRNMELHIWLPTYYVGMKADANTRLSVGTKKPEWLAVSNLGGNYAPDNKEGGYQMLNPANEEAAAFLLETYKYILTTYDVDGFELDYIRYWTNIEGCDFGYDDITTAAFKAETGIDPKFDTTASYWKEWVTFRTKYVTKMVEKVRALIDEVNPSVLLTAAVGPNIEDAYNHLYQDYMTWLEEGYLDLLHPMSYGEGFEDEIAAQVENCGDDTFIAVGLGIFMDEYGAADMLRQAKMVNELGADGSAYFEASSYLSKGTADVLLNSIYRNKAITPTYNKSAAIIESLNYSMARIDDVILPLEGMTAAEADRVKEAFNAIIANVNAEASSEDSFAAAKTAIDTLANEKATSVLLTDLAYAQKIAEVALRIPDTYEISVDTSSDSSIVSEVSQGTAEPSSNDWVLPVIIIVSIIIIAGIFIIVAGKKKKNNA